VLNVKFEFNDIPKHIKNDSEQRLSIYITKYVLWWYKIYIAIILLL